MKPEQPTYHEHIIQDPDIPAGKPVIKGTRIPLDLVLAKLLHNPDLAELIADYPRLTIEDVKASLKFAQHLVLKEKRARKPVPTSPNG